MSAQKHCEQLHPQATAGDLLGSTLKSVVSGPPVLDSFLSPTRVPGLSFFLSLYLEDPRTQPDYLVSRADKQMRGHS